MDIYLGAITIFGGYYAPAGWAFCHGQLLSISEYETLFELLGTTYGGDGEQTFALPDLRGRSIVGAGKASGLTERSLAEQFGSEATPKAASEEALKAGTAPLALPYLGVNYIISLQGIFPSPA